MGWSIRKSFSSGPVRFNLSKSGIGVSTGMPGARLSFNRHGVNFFGGRGGLYYRQRVFPPPRVKPSPAPTAAASRLAGRSLIAEQASAFFTNRQFKAANLNLELTLRHKTRRFEKIALACGCMLLVNWGVGWLFSQLAPRDWWGLLIGSGFLLWMLYRRLGAYRERKKSDALYRLLSLRFIEQSEGITDANLQDTAALVRRITWGRDAVHFALYRFYLDYLRQLLGDMTLTETEAANLDRIDRMLDLHPAQATMLRHCAFNRVYLEVIGDEALSKEEDAFLQRTQEVLRLSNEDIREELDTLSALRSVRELQEHGLTAISVTLPLSNGEVCYHQTQGRVVKEKIVKSFTSQGERHQVKGWVADRSGDFYLTSKRLMVVGDGVTSVVLSKIMDVDTDLDQNAVTLDVDGRKTALVLTMPDSLVFSAKLDALLKGGARRSGESPATNGQRNGAASALPRSETQELAP